MPTSFFRLSFPKIGWSFSDICLEVIKTGQHSKWYHLQIVQKAQLGVASGPFFPANVGPILGSLRSFLVFATLVVGLFFPSVHCAQSRPHREGGQRGVRLHLHHQGAGDWDVHHGDEQFLKYKR